MYTELHLHTCYSFLEGASRPEEMAVRAAELGYTALGVTDHDGMYGVMEFAQACAATGIQPITGVELSLVRPLWDGGREAEGGRQKAGGRGAQAGRVSTPVHLTLLAETVQGYGNLCLLVTEEHRSSPR